MQGHQSFEIYTESTSRTTGMPNGMALSSGASSHMRGSIATGVPKGPLKRKARANYSNIKNQFKAIAMNFKPKSLVRKKTKDSRNKSPRSALAHTVENGDEPSSIEIKREEDSLNTIEQPSRPPLSQTPQN